MRKLAIPATLAVTVLGLSACQDDEPPCEGFCAPIVTTPIDGGVDATPVSCPAEPDDELHAQNEGCAPGCERHYCFA